MPLEEGNLDEKELVRRSGKGDFLAFQKIVKLYQKRVFSFAYYHLRNRADAEDLTQELFWRVFSNLGKYNPSKKFFTWLFTLEINLIRNFIREKRPRKEVMDMDFYENIGFHDQTLLSADDRMALMDIIGQLPEQDQELIYFKYVDDLSVKEIAAVYNTSEDNIKVKLFRSREKLKQKIGKLEEWENAPRVLFQGDAE